MSNPWEQRRLGDMSEIKAGGTPSTQNLSYWEPKQIPWLSSGEVHKKRIHFTDNMISQKGLVNSSAQWIPEQSVLIALAGQGKTRGTVAVNEVPLTTNQSIAAIILSDELETNFVFSNLEGRYQELRSMSSGDGSRGGLNKQLVSSITIPYTNIKEQKQIGTFFQKLDETITLYQRKLDLLKRKKQAYLQKMFPRDGEDIPEFRFDGFTDPWEQREFGEIALRLSKTCDDPSMLNVEYEDIVSNTGTLNKDLRTKVGGKKGFIFQPGNILYGKLRPYLHNWLNPSFSGLAVGDFWVLQPVDGVSDFLYYLIQTPYFDFIANQSTGTKMPRADWKNVSNSIFSVPKDIDEQKTIGQFFGCLDKAITLHQRKLDLLKKKKQAYLQNMFPGEGEDEPRWRFKEFVEQE